MSTNAEINGGGERPLVVAMPVGNATIGVLKPGEATTREAIGELTVDELTTSELAAGGLAANAPAIPRADAVDGLCSRRSY